MGAVGYSERAFDDALVQSLQLLADRLGVAILYSQARVQLALQSAALESAANAIVITDLSGRVRWVNTAFEPMTGYRSDQAVGQELLGEGEGYHEPGYREAWARLKAGHAWRGEVTNRTRDGVEYAEDVTIAPVRDASGAPTHAVIVKQDVSERVRLERLKTDFVAMVSHELRTPLTTIIGYADLLTTGGDALDAERVSSANTSIKQSGQRMKRMVEQLLEVTQIQAEGVEVKTAAFDLGHLVAEVVQSVPCGDRHELHLDVPVDLPPIEIDARRISHALRNIVENAVKYSPEGGAIRVGVRREAEQLVVSVADEGVGMSEEEIPRLFEAFSQQDMSSTRSFGGIGMGLFVAYEFVAAHGGRIEVLSRRGHGSTFEVYLPLGRG
jgi:PAS domain S-box-containing protein